MCGAARQRKVGVGVSRGRRDTAGSASESEEGVRRGDTQPAMTTQDCDETDCDNDADESTRSESECEDGSEDDNEDDEDGDADEVGSGVDGRSVDGGGCDSADGREASDGSRRRRRGRWLAVGVEVRGEDRSGRETVPPTLP